MGDLTIDETYVWERQATMLQDVTALVLAHGPHSKQPLPPLNWEFNEWAVSVQLSENSLTYDGKGFLDQPQRGRAEAVEIWAAALGVPAVRHRWSNGDVEVVAIARIGPAGSDGKARTTISIRALMKVGEAGWTPAGPGEVTLGKDAVR
jgi:hypothetical protein